MRGTLLLFVAAWPVHGQACTRNRRHVSLAPSHRQASLFFSPSCSNATQQPCQELFCPIYSLAVSEDPLVETENATQMHLAVGLDSGALCMGAAVAAVTGMLLMHTLVPLASLSS